MQNNFNDTVNELKDFNLNPSEQVWKEIESTLDQKKKKRIVAWWWSMPAILLFGVAFFVYNRNNGSNSKIRINNSTSTKSDITSLQSNKTSVKSNLTSTESSLTSMKSNSTSTKSDLTSLQSNKTSVKSNLTSTESSLISMKSNSTSTKSDLTSLQSNKTSVKSNLASTEISLTSMKSNLTSTKSNLTSLQSNKTSVKSNLTSTESSLTSMKSNSKSTKSNLTSLQSDLTAEIIKNETLQNKNIDTVKRIDSNSSKENTIAKTIKKSKKTVWGLAIGGGANYVSRNNVLGQQNESSFYNSGLTSTPSTATASNPSSNILNLPKTGYHFSLGVNVEKQLSKKLSLESGLMYRYVESKIIFQNNSVTNFLSTSSQEYKNNLHLLELPVGLKYCFNPSSKNKLSLLVGGNVAIALKRNWLFVNDDLHLYQENSNEINTVLFGLQTGASINFNNKFSLSLVAQKNITSVQKSSSKYYLQQIDFQLNIPFKSLKK